MLFHDDSPHATWVITEDHLDGKAVGIYGPSWADEGDKVELLKKHNPNREKFQLLDDDGNLYYEGFVQSNGTGFEPLDDFGMGYAGCTTVKIWNKEYNVFEVL